MIKKRVCTCGNAHKYTNLKEERGSKREIDLRRRPVGGDEGKKKGEDDGKKTSKRG